MSADLPGLEQEGRDPVFPPLMQGRALPPGADPMRKACAEAALGCDAGLLCWSLSAEALRVALVLAPETALEPAMAAWPACAFGLQNALGALAPPEVSVHFDWAGAIRVNGARCGRVRAAAAPTDPAAEPDWLVIGLDLRLIPPRADAPGETPDDTGLFAEGCAGLDPVALLEAWARHTMHGLSRLDDAAGRAALHRDWRGVVWALGEPCAEAGREGMFLGLDENFGMLLRPEGADTILIPLSSRLNRS